MLRITVIGQTREEVVLKVEGWLVNQDVAVLEQEGDKRLQQTELLMLDLKGVRFIDDAGIALLKRWSGARLALRSASPFIRALLVDQGLASSLWLGSL